jgi:hypothetical protein
MQTPPLIPAEMLKPDVMHAPKTHLGRHSKHQNSAANKNATSLLKAESLEFNMLQYVCRDNAVEKTALKRQINSVAQH